MLKEFASDLKASREGSNISLAEISAQTRINETFLKKLESGDFSFQQEIYIKAFIKEYAKAIKLDPAEVIKDYEAAKRGDYKPKNTISDIPEIEPQEDLSEVDKEENDKPQLEEEIELESDPKKEGKTQKKQSIQESVKDDVKDDLKKDTKEIPAAKEEKEKEEKKQEEKIDEERKVIPLKRRSEAAVHKAPIVEEKKPSRKENLNLPEAVEKDGPFSFRESGGDSISPSVLRTIGIIFLGLLLAVGLYFMGKALFFEGDSEDGPEIVRQKFDDVVQENERKLLGKRTEQEIQDSIRKAEEEAQRLIEQNLDTMTLVINSIRSGSVIVVEDSTDINNPEKISFTGNQYGTWKATRFFLITSPNTSAFTVELNGKKIDIKEKNVKNYLISRKDLVSSDTTNTTNQ